MLKSDSIAKLAEALSKVQGQLKAAKKDSINPFFHSKYADLDSVWEACRNPLAEQGLAVSQLLDMAEQGVIIETMLMHTSGEWLGGRLHLVPLKTDPQSIGSAISYGRRYSLAAILGITQEDDDAEATTQRASSLDKPVEPTQPTLPSAGRTSPIAPSKANGKETGLNPKEGLNQKLKELGHKTASQQALWLEQNGFLARSISALGEGELKDALEKAKEV